MPSGYTAGVQEGRFGHHPDPAVDFCVEVESLESIITDKELGLRTDEPHPRERFERAMEFRVGGDADAVRAKGFLRSLGPRVDSLPPSP